ncbi:MAG: class I SAM-dependent methyltransferase [Opitutales bacterium]|nr:class I SAM-dependent methyltransferase [Opitutales bacterium]
MNRVVEAEILDSLAFDDADAIRNRSEITRINRWMGNWSWIQKTLNLKLPEQGKILEIGAGDGILSHFTSAHSNQTYTGLDVVPRPTNLFPNAKWISAKVQDFEKWSDYSTIISNFFLHQLNDTEIRKIGLMISESARSIVINEPYRSRLHLTLCKPLFRLLGYGPVTQHDGFLSIRAGFRGDELQTLLGLDPFHWNIQRSATLLGAYRFAATRITG